MGEGVGEGRRRMEVCTSRGGRKRGERHDGPPAIIMFEAYLFDGCLPRGSFASAPLTHREGAVESYEMRGTSALEKKNGASADQTPEVEIGDWGLVFAVTF